MNYRQLGNTGITVSGLGFGTWPLSGTSYGPVDEYQARSTLHDAFRSGIIFFDTADVYGDGGCERLLGDVFHRRRHEIIIATKGGMLPHVGREWVQDFTPEYLVQALDASLHRLKTDYVDLYLLHSPPEDIGTIAPALRQLQRFKREGKVRAIGVSVRTPEIALSLIGAWLVDVIEANFNLIDQRIQETGIKDTCLSSGKGFIARTLLAFGFLTGRYHPGVSFFPPDHRANWSQEQIDLWVSAPARFSSLTTSDRGISHLALQYRLHHPAVSTVIPGMMNRVEVAHNLEILDIPPLSADELLEIRRIYHEHEWREYAT